MAGKGSSSKGKGMPGPPSRDTLLFKELLEISEENYDQQMLAAVSLFEFSFENYRLDNCYFAFRWIDPTCKFEFVLLGCLDTILSLSNHTIFSFSGIPLGVYPLAGSPYPVMS